MAQYDEQQEAAASHEVIDSQGCCVHQHGVVVDIGGKTRGPDPASEFTDTEIPRPEPNATIEVQRTGEHKDGYAIVSYQKVLRRKTWEKIEASFKPRKPSPVKLWTASRRPRSGHRSPRVSAGFAV